MADYRQRNIFVAVAFLGVPESTARALALLFMEDYGSFKQTLLDSFSRPSADEWTVDYDKISGIAGGAEQRADLNPQALPFPQPRAADFDDKADGARSQENIKQLCREIRDCCFSEGDGLKLLVAATPPQAGYEKALEEADRLLWAEGSKDDLLASRKKSRARSESYTVEEIRLAIESILQEVLGHRIPVLGEAIQSVGPARRFSEKVVDHLRRHRSRSGSDGEV